MARKSRARPSEGGGGGAQRDPRMIIEETGPQAAEAMHAQDVDLVLLVPV